MGAEGWGAGVLRALWAQESDGQCLEGVKVRDEAAGERIGMQSGADEIDDEAAGS
jgi:hypothetical protein